MSIQKVSVTKTGVGERQAEIGEIEKSAPLLPSERVSVNTLSPAELAASLADGKSVNSIAGMLIGTYIGAEYSWNNRAFHQDSLIVVEQLMRYFSERTAHLTEHEKPRVIPAFQIANRQWMLRRRWQQLRMNDAKELTVSADKAEATKSDHAKSEKPVAQGQTNLNTANISTAGPAASGDDASMRMIAIGLLWGFVNTYKFQEALDFARGCLLLWPGDRTVQLLQTYSAMEMKEPLDPAMREAVQQVQSTEIRTLLQRRAPLNVS